MKARIIMVRILIFTLLSLPLYWSCKNTSSTNTNVVDSTHINVPFADKNPESQDSLITLLQTMPVNSLNCNATAYWQIIKRGKASIPLLINNLTNTRMTNIYDSCKQDRLNVGKLCCFALQEIVSFPAFAVTQIQFDVIDNGCWNFYDYLFNNNNKREYQQVVLNFYKNNHFVFTRFGKEDLDDCHQQYQITGKYKWVR